MEKNSDKIKKQILSTLKADDRLWNENKTELNQTLLLDLVDKIDECVIGLLLQEEDLKNKFFVKIKDSFVFKTNEFRFFMEENKIDNSYTSYKNRIGLSDGKRFLKDTNDIVLDFPYKDCVLEGGQSTEEGLDAYYDLREATYKNKLDENGKVIKNGRNNVKEIDVPAHYEMKTSKRKEIFFNSVLAHDEIDRLFDPKALTNWKRYTKDGAQDVTEIKRDENGTIKENLIIKGNNLLALHSLKKEFAGKVKLIYIDPPYNPDSVANTFAYNNNFNHSTWLTFIKNRADVSKIVLSDDGLYCIAIDHYEIFYLGVLLDEIFGRENRIGIVAVETNPGGRSDSNFFATSNEYFIVYAKNINLAKINKLNLTKDQIKQYKLRDSISCYKLVPLRRTGSNSTPDKRPNLYFPIYYNPNNNDISFLEKKDYIKILPLGSNGVMRVWRWSKDKIKQDISDIEIKKTNGNYSVFVKDRIKDGKKPKTLWYGSQYDASSHGTKLLQKFNLEENFSYPKPVYLLKDIIKILSNKNDIIIDYHSGSGTTAQAILDLNKEDDGNRKFIMIEQMSYINTITCPRIQKVMEIENIDDSFIYFELAKWNETAKEKIMNCESLNELLNLFDEMYNKYFLNYNLKIKEFKEKVIKEEEFQDLPIEEQKKIFLAMLDNNQMYVNKTEMADKMYGISREDQNLTSQFYNSEK